MDETDVYEGVGSLKESIVDVLDPASLQDNNNTGSVLVETRLQDNLEKDNVSDMDETIQSLDSGKNSTKQDDESEQKEIISRDSGTLSPVSSGSKTHANVTKKIGSLNDALNPKISPKMDDSSDSSESRKQAPYLPGNHQMTKEKHPPKISRYERKINQPLRFKD
ncbi:Hypothetical predicted protein [Mytilus galloprovincialis]|uniref:Uncharacterized protein n=1 Tax=Mytilus galloprovincialis TaxID=29158 RepID=A0A8B6F946_MYTGA|nr:Hypothetical predicted protein [Mytilus galloprovincialis]